MLRPGFAMMPIAYLLNTRLSLHSDIDSTEKNDMKATRFSTLSDDICC